MPMFRWHEHVKDGFKGNVLDLVFDTITKVKSKDQKYINEIEAWWIQKYVNDYGIDNVFNIRQPPITFYDLKEQYDLIIKKDK